MIQLTDLKICENWGNMFAKIVKGDPVNSCSACKDGRRKL
jgi:hypothetical protein